MLTLLKNIGKVTTPISNGAPYFIEVVEKAAIVIEDDKFKFVGPEKELPRFHFDKEYDCQGKLATPGLIDPHTHPIFAATRENEFHLRNTGFTYAEIAASGGGIRSSVRELRKASIDTLIELLKVRFDQFLRLGTTTIEAKSGYGLSLDDELKSLRALQALKEHSLEVIPTFLGAHEIPDEFRSNRQDYIRLLIEEMIPAVAEENLAQYCDIFVEQSVYTSTEARRILNAAKNAGLKPRLHVDQLTSGEGAELAAEMGAVSADHLDYISDQGIEKMVEKGVVFTLLPGAVFFLGHDKYPPARKIIEKGGIIALATDYNPGSSMTRSLPMMMTLACIYMKMNADEALAAITLNAARALEMDSVIGSIETGKQADLALWDAAGHDYIPYHYAENLVSAVFKKGRLIYNERQKYTLFL